MPNPEYAWNASDYARNSSAQFGWATELIQKLELKGHERILDVGSGSGRVTAALAAEVPEGTVVGIDSSPDMVDLAAGAFPPADHPNLDFRCLDARELSFAGEFDVAFSNATLHWVRDHPAVLRGIRRSLRDDGRTLLQMGGTGNAAGIIAVMDRVRVALRWRRYFQGFTFPYAFYGPDDYAAWLPDANLKPLRIELIPKDMVHQGREELAGWIRTTWLPYTGRVPDERRETFIDEVLEIYLAFVPLDEEGQTHVRMVRLEVEAVPD